MDGPEPTEGPEGTGSSERASFGRRLPRATEPEGFLERIIASSPVLIFREVTSDLSFGYLSPNITSILGYAPEEVLGIPSWWSAHVHPEDRQRVLDQLPQDLAAKVPTAEREFRVLHKDGTYRWFHTVMRMEYDEAGRPAAVVGYASDITERRHMEEALREAEAKYRSLVEQLPAVVYVAGIGQTGEWLYISPQIQAMLGYSPEEWMAHPNPFASHLHPDDRERVLAEEERAHEAGEPLRSEYRLRARDGRTLWVLDIAGPVRIDGGEPGFWQGIMFDITDRRRAEEELRETTQRFRRVAATAHDAIVEIDDRGRVVFWNEAAERIFGFPASEAEGRTLHSLIAPPAYREPFERGFASFRETGRGPVVGKLTEITALRRDGTELPVELSVTPLQHPGGWGALGIARDVTERKRAETEREESLALLRKLDAERRRLLEHVVGAQEEERQGLASDIYDGPLEKMTALGLQLEVLRRRCSEPLQLETITQLEGTVEHVIGGLRHLIFELRPPVLEREGLAAALHGYLEETAEEAGFDYHIENHLAGEPPLETRTILYRIAQEALNNVRKHARATRVDVLLEPREGGFFVRIADDGMGFVAEEEAAALTGAVGLTAMRERADMAGGWWRVESAPGRGTTVEFWLPAEGGPEPPRADRR